ncbi:dephospho-CoA kinase [Myroides guanonis]|uniref:Dephospho-CoA kinase n=1 Tax=Myroides guanonis TaxID=1150112 RepID=A0A1I3LGG4_9FLAO|nr:dephospho-CoA kinase [Myroides guanonis]SFI83536.1 dephospho-CoA kinase [Myroides guanonis]
MTKVICLTGGIGSGKTTVARMFEKHGIPVYISDERAKLIMMQSEIIQQIQTIFEEPVIQEGILDRKKIRELVFDNKELLDRLNSIVHPAVANDFKDWVRSHSDKAYVLKESAILFETNSQSACEKIILVTAPEEVRIRRVVERDGVSKEGVKKIINQQISDYEKGKLSDFIIKNIDIKEVEKEVLMIIRDFLS